MGKSSNYWMYAVPGLGQAKLVDEALLAPGRRMEREQKRALEDQAQVQQEALAQSERVRRENELAANRQNRKQPDLGSLLTDAKAPAFSGVGSTLLSGPLGVDRKHLKLTPQPTLLGA